MSTKQTKQSKTVFFPNKTKKDIGMIIGLKGENFKRIAKLVGKGLWITHLNNELGSFKIEAYTRAALVKGEQELRHLIADMFKPIKTPKAKKSVKPQKTVNSFAVLETDYDSDSDSDKVQPQKPKQRCNRKVYLNTTIKTRGGIREKQQERHGWVVKKDETKTPSNDCENLNETNFPNLTEEMRHRVETQRLRDISSNNQWNDGSRMIYEVPKPFEKKTEESSGIGDKLEAFQLKEVLKVSTKNTEPQQSTDGWGKENEVCKNIFNFNPSKIYTNWADDEGDDEGDEEEVITLNGSA